MRSTSDLNSRAVFLVASACAAAAHAGAAAEQVRAHRLDGPRGRAAGQHRELPRLRRRGPQDHRQGFRTHPSPGRGRRLKQGKPLLVVLIDVRFSFVCVALVIIVIFDEH